MPLRYNAGLFSEPAYAGFFVPAVKNAYKSFHVSFFSSNQRSRMTQT